MEICSALLILGDVFCNSDGADSWFGSHGSTQAAASCLLPRGGSGRPCSPVPSEHFSQGLCSSVAESSLLPASSLGFLVAKGNFPDIRVFVQ